jgi:hypothetical protein
MWAEVAENRLCSSVNENVPNFPKDLESKTINVKY